MIGISRFVVWVAIVGCLGLSLRNTAGATQEATLKNDFAVLPNDAMNDWQTDWIQLFDRATTFGWRGVNPSAVNAGQLLLRAGDLPRTSAQFSEFTLHVKYQLAADSQAEVLLFASPRSREPGVDHVSLRLTPEDHQLVVVVARDAQAGGLMTVKFLLKNAAGESASEPQTIETDLGRGYLGFRVTAGTLKIEQVSLRPTFPSSQLYSSLDSNNGFDLRGLGAATAEMVEEGIAVRGGPGYLATSETYGDFVFSVDARTQVGTNSGIFFRCIPGESLNGYESQIHNGYLAGDRAQPEDCGTGGIFRRVNARRVVADNGEWFRKMIVVCGGQISVWVNGYQVTDWSDQRPPNENPRRGRRLEAGPVMLQAHDPGTQVEFKSLRIFELPAR
jgi:hypothetical protein